MAWMQAASFGVSALGHVLNRTGGRKKVRASLADTSFIDDEVESIKSRNQEMTDKFLRTASAGVGFADATRQRMGNAMGVAGGQSLLDQSRMGGMEAAFGAGMQNEMASQQNVNQLMNTRAGLEQFNAQALNNAEATNFQAARADSQNFFNTVGAGLLGMANQRYDSQRFGQSMQLQNRMLDQNDSMMQHWMNQNTGLQGRPLLPPGSSPNFNNFG